MCSYRDSTVKMVYEIYLYVLEMNKRFSVSQTAGNVIVSSIGQQAVECGAISCWREPVS